MDDDDDDDIVIFLPPRKDLQHIYQNMQQGDIPILVRKIIELNKQLR